MSKLADGKSPVKQENLDLFVAIVMGRPALTPGQQLLKELVRGS